MLMRMTHAQGRHTSETKVTCDLTINYAIDMMAQDRVLQNPAIQAFELGVLEGWNLMRFPLALSRHLSGSSMQTCNSNLQFHGTVGIRHLITPRAEFACTPANSPIFCLYPDHIYAPPPTERCPISFAKLYRYV